MRLPDLPSFSTLLTWWIAGSAVWLVAVNRVLSHLPDGTVKRTAILGSLALLGLGSTVCATAWVGWRALVVPIAVMSLLAVGEIRRIALRCECAASPPIATSRQPAGLLKPLTTTHLVARQYELVVPELPVARLRVVHLSDLHVGGGLPIEYYRSALELAASYNPDVALVTGDLVFRREDVDALRRLLTDLQRPRLGSFAVLGNHDHWASADAVRQVLRDAGITLVHGRCQPLGLSAKNDVFLCGDEHPWGPRPLSYPRNGTTLVLSHTPDNIYDQSAAGATGVFAGHLHGGQLRLPWLGALIVPSRYGRRFDRGHFLVGSTHLFVSSGVGGVPLRLWCEPDLVVVDLVAAKVSE